MVKSIYGFKIKNNIVNIESANEENALRQLGKKLVESGIAEALGEKIIIRRDDCNERN